ncbi:hypothetical protein [Mariprofundus ferrooxydans]|nr:hypothetical protein [Mariprofundus ferrooxydans]
MDSAMRDMPHGSFIWAEPEDAAKTRMESYNENMREALKSRAAAEKTEAA